MKILVIGLFVFISWSAFSTYIYVCKIKGLCYEPVPRQTDKIKTIDKIGDETSEKLSIQKQAIMPDKLIIYFDYNKSEMNSTAAAAMYYEKSNAFFNENTNASLMIIGHTDEFGTTEYNQDLGYRRAQSLQHYFENKGIPANKINIESKGEKEPAAENNTKSGRTINRRTVITIIK